MSGADRLNFRQADKARSAISTGVHIQRLDQHAQGKLAMTESQIKTAFGLLKKTLPDLKVSDAEMMDSGELQRLSWDK